MPAVSEQAGKKQGTPKTKHTDSIIEPGNIDLNNRPVVHNKNGSISTVRSVAFTLDNGNVILLPTVIGGRVVSNQEALNHWRKTGKHLGIFSSQEAADSYAKQLHNQQAAIYAPSFGGAIGIESIKGRPHPALQSHGFQGGVGNFNERLDLITKAYQTKNGILPPPGLVFSIAISRVPTGDITTDLFNIPKSKRQARIQGLGGRLREKEVYEGPSLGVASEVATSMGEVSGKTPADRLMEAWRAEEVTDTSPDLDVIAQLLNASQTATEPDFNKFLSENEEELVTLAHKAEYAPRILAILNAKAGEVEEAAREAVPTIQKIAGIPPLAAKQIAGTIPQIPFGVYAAGKAGVHDIRYTPQILAGKEESQTGLLFEGLLHQVKRDIQNPDEYPGFLLLDALAVTSAGSGILARTGQVARVAGETSEAGRLVRMGRAAKAFTERPRGGTYTLKAAAPGVEDALEVNLLMSENQFVNRIQRFIHKRQQKKLDEREEGIPASMSRNGSIAKSKRWVQNNFGVKGKIGRELKTRLRIESAARMAQKIQLDRTIGWTRDQSRIITALGKKRWGGLSRGEQMAIRAMSFDDANPIAALRKLSQDTIDNVDYWAPVLSESLGIQMDAEFLVARHQARLADIKLAEAILKSDKPRARFLKAAQLTRDLMYESERMKIEDLGLTPTRAEQAIIKKGARVRGEEIVQNPAETQLLTLDGEGNLIPLSRQVPDSYYLPDVSELTSVRISAPRGATVRAGKFGVPRPRDTLPELRYENTGTLIRAGLDRVDATTLAGWSYARTVQAVGKIHLYRELLKDASPLRRTEFDVPIRKAEAIDPELRLWMNRLDDGAVISSEEAELLDSTSLAALDRRLFPDEGGADTLWVDSRYIRDMGKMSPNHPILRGFNTPVVFASIYLKPTYIINLIQNAAMFAYDAGLFRSGEFLLKAAKSKELFGEKVSVWLDSAMGDSRMTSYLPSEATAGKRFTSAVAGGWQALTDRVPRRAALIYQLKRLGYNSERFEEIRQATLHTTTPEAKAIVKDFNEAVRRAQKSMVEFDNLTWFEREWLRHLIYVYPWQSRSIVWSLKSIVEHPVKFDVLEQLTANTIDNEDPIISKMPGWLKRAGYFPTGWTADGKPKLSNAMSMNTFSTLGEVYNVLTGEEFPIDLASPHMVWMVHSAVGRDKYWNKYDGNAVLGATKEMIYGMPQAAAVRKGMKKDEALPPLDITNKRMFIQQESAALKQAVLQNGWGAAIGGFLGSTYYEREYNVDAGTARWWRNQPPNVRLKHEIALIKKGIKYQAEFLKRKVPSDVTDGINFIGQLQAELNTFAEDRGNPPTPKERAELAIDTLLKTKRINNNVAQDLRDKLKDAVDENDVTNMKNNWIRMYGNGKALNDWEEKVQFVNRFSREPLTIRMRILKKRGLIKTTNLPKDDDVLLDYGRQVLAYNEKIDRLLDAALDMSDDDKKLARAELRVLEDEADKPMVVGGHTFPSAPRISWSLEDKPEAVIRSLIKSSWKNLSAFDKELLGHPAPKGTARGWQMYDGAEVAYRKQYPGASITSEQRLSLAKQIDKTVPGFFKEYLFSKEPKIRRFESTVLYQNMPKDIRPSFDHFIATPATTFTGAMDSGNYNKSELRAYWKKYVTEQLTPWLEEPEQTALRAWLQPYGPSFIMGLVNK